MRIYTNIGGIILNIVRFAGRVALDYVGKEIWEKVILYNNWQWVSSVRGMKDREYLKLKCLSFLSECDWMSFGNVYIICLKRVEDWDRVKDREREHKIKKEGMYKRKVCSVWKIYTYSWMELRVRVILRHRVYWTLHSNIVRLSCIYICTYYF